jgi:DNA-binding MarR family transcriptional regulator
MNTTDREESLTLGILETIEGRKDLTQRHLADQLGIALGLANSYLKRCIRKGLVKVQQVPANRYLYYLTPQGFAEKSRLTAAYLSRSFTLYRRASADYAALFHECAAQGCRRVAFCGRSELAEIAQLRARECGVQVLGVENVGPGGEVPGAAGADALVLTALGDAAETFNRLRAAGHRVLVPAFLRFVENAPPATAGGE